MISELQHYAAMLNEMEWFAANPHRSFEIVRRARAVLDKTVISDGAGDQSRDEEGKASYDWPTQAQAEPYDLSVVQQQLIRAMRQAKTWHSVTLIADALVHVHILWNSMESERKMSDYGPRSAGTQGAESDPFATGAAS